MAFGEYQKRSIAILFVALIFGAAFGALLGDVLGLLLPEGVVKQFFLQSVSWGLSPTTIDLLVISVTFGLRLKFSISSVLGLGIVYYFLRYFR
ncbi:MAG: DUF4321 domain-containing protein [Candidatus Marinimicrobia bacterium]|nr:DUF4321 domain-containing protein [Candidatus Neomarinimicrobiota bacterium]